MISAARWPSPRACQARATDEVDVRAVKPGLVDLAQRRVGVVQQGGRARRLGQRCQAAQPVRGRPMRLAARQTLLEQRDRGVRRTGVEQRRGVHRLHRGGEPGMRFHVGGPLAVRDRILGTPGQPRDPAEMGDVPGGVTGVPRAQVDRDASAHQRFRVVPAAGGEVRERRLEHAPLQQPEVAGLPDPRLHLVEHRGQFGHLAQVRVRRLAAVQGGQQRRLVTGRERGLLRPPAVRRTPRGTSACCSAAPPASRAGGPPRRGHPAARQAASAVPDVCDSLVDRMAGTRPTPGRRVRTVRPSPAGARRSPGHPGPPPCDRRSPRSKRKPVSRTRPRARWPRPTSSASPTRRAASIAWSYSASASAIA